MADRRLGLIMHGVTGRMGYNQHLVRSILAIRDQGGVVLSNGDRLVVDPIIVGRDAEIGSQQHVHQIVVRLGVERPSAER